MARTPSINEGNLTKMELRKLNALRKSVGDEIAAKAFKEWYEARPATGGATQATDKTAEAIAGAIMGLIKSGKIKALPRGGYVLKRGRGRVVVSPAS